MSAVAIASRAIEVGAVLVLMLGAAPRVPFRQALAVAIDLLTAAGLLGLAGDPSWRRVAITAVLVLVRQLVRFEARQLDAERHLQTPAPS